jgi:hypothetical protein
LLQGTSATDLNLDGGDLYCDDITTNDKVIIGGTLDVQGKISNSTGYVRVDDVFVAESTFAHTGSSLGFYNAGAATKPTVTGSRAGNAALASLLTKLALLGLITDSTT